MGNKYTSSVSDFDLVREAKEGKSPESRREAKKTLFLRYKKMVHKHYHWLQRKYPSIAADIGGPEGYTSEAYLALERLIEKTPLDFLRGTPENGGARKILFFSWYLSSLNRSLIRGMAEIRPSLEDIAPPPPEEGEGEGPAEEFFLPPGAEAAPVNHEERIYQQEAVAEVKRAVSQIPCPGADNISGWTVLWDSGAMGKSRASIARELGLQKWVVNRVYQQAREAAQKVLS